VAKANRPFLLQPRRGVGFRFSTKALIKRLGRDNTTQPADEGGGLRFDLPPANLLSRRRDSIYLFSQNYVVVECAASLIHHRSECLTDMSQPNVIPALNRTRRRQDFLGGTLKADYGLKLISGQSHDGQGNRLPSPSSSKRAAPGAVCTEGAPCGPCRAVARLSGLIRSS
jgi:hypothetical protein